MSRNTTTHSPDSDRATLILMEVVEKQEGQSLKIRRGLSLLKSEVDGQDRPENNNPTALGFWL